jgi:hypothetical protein
MDERRIAEIEKSCLDCDWALDPKIAMELITALRAAEKVVRCVQEVRKAEDALMNASLAPHAWEAASLVFDDAYEALWNELDKWEAANVKAMAE